MKRLDFKQKKDRDLKATMNAYEIECVCGHRHMRTTFKDREQEGIFTCHCRKIIEWRVKIQARIRPKKVKNNG